MVNLSTRTLDKSKYFFSFYKNLESLLYNYIKNKRDGEIFLGMIGKLSGKNKKLAYEIKDIIPFPNLSCNPKIIATPPEDWLLIIEERILFLNENLKFIGFIHSHPQKSSKKSELDENFSVQLLHQFGSLLMIIIGYDFTLRCYLVDEDKTKLIPGNVLRFKLKMQ